MLKLLTTMLFAVITAFCLPTYAAKTAFSLKELSDVVVQILNHEKAIPDSTAEKLSSEIKLKLKSAGLSIQPDASKTKKLVVVEIKKLPRITQSDISVKLMLVEEISIKRKTQVNAVAITYFDEAFFTSANETKDVPDVVMDKLLVRFINQYLEENPG